jgi:hypothetical protein
LAAVRGGATLVGLDLDQGEIAILPRVCSRFLGSAEALFDLLDACVGD